jgi:uncharacterized Zn finger protein (UPF0148 family)
MIIYGSKARQKEISQGQFFCPVCKRIRNYKQYRINRYFTLFFIPIFPTKKLSEFIVCQGCMMPMSSEALQLTSSNTQGDSYYLGVSGFTARNSSGNYCTSCGSPCLEGDMYCSNCGAKLASHEDTIRHRLLLIWKRHSTEIESRFRNLMLASPVASACTDLLIATEGTINSNDHEKTKAYLRALLINVGKWGEFEKLTATSKKHNADPEMGALMRAFAAVAHDILKDLP